MRRILIAFTAANIWQSAIAADAVPPIPELRVSSPATRSVVVGTRPLRYTAEYAELDLASATGVPQAVISATSYVVAARDPRRTPVLFAFNGGPGASSSPLQFGVMGPRIRGDDGKAMVDNPQSPLDMADLVFIDPVGTGFSRVLPGGSGHRYFSIDGDAAATSSIIHAWLKRNHREGSPIYIAGESYGGTRLASLLPAVDDLDLAGLILISPAIDMPSEGSDLAAVLTLPSLAVAALQNGRIEAHGLSVPAIFEKARVFAEGPYASALLQGSSLPLNAQREIARELSGLVGISPDQLLDDHLKIDVEAFRNNLRRSDGLVVGRLDSRITAPAPATVPGRPSAANDPVLGLGNTNTIVSQPITDYYREELGVAPTRTYVSLTLDVNFQWQWPPAQGPAALGDLSRNITSAMKTHPRLHILTVGGYYDLAVPALMPRYSIEHAWVPMDRIEIATLETGHSVFEKDMGRRKMKSLLKSLFWKIGGQK